ncbi:MAG: hypothetical protein AAB784_00680 [Patescibacteria group bacterium]
MGHICSECTFVNSAKDIFVDRKTRDKAGRKPIYVGTFTLPKYTGHLKFYLFICSCCEQIVIDHPSGYTDGGFLFFVCGSCKWASIIYDKKIYVDAGIPKPSLIRDIFCGLWRMIKFKKCQVASKS